MVGSTGVVRASEYGPYRTGRIYRRRTKKKEKVNEKEKENLVSDETGVGGYA